MSLYCTPKIVTDLKECVFYHTMDIPGYGTVEGQWDLRGSADEYLGGIELKGKRVLELGCASGFLTFYMESKGAEIVAYDLSEKDNWDVVPYSLPDRVPPVNKELYPSGVKHWRDWADARRKGTIAVNNAFWLAWHAFKSKAKLVTGPVYDLPTEIGYVDVSTFGAILLHLRDPFLALYKALRLTREIVVVTDIAPNTVSHSIRGEETKHAGDDFPSGPYAKFIPDPKAGNPLDIWWNLSPEIVVQMLGVLGFERFQVTTSQHKFLGHKIPLYTVVAHRTAEIDSMEDIKQLSSYLS